MDFVEGLKDILFHLTASKTCKRVKRCINVLRPVTTNKDSEIEIRSPRPSCKMFWI
jgi:hypothetical protein